MVSVHALFHISVDHAGIIPLLLIFLADEFGDQRHHPSGNRNDHDRNECQLPVDRHHHDDHSDKLENAVDRIRSGGI